MKKSRIARISYLKKRLSRRRLIGGRPVSCPSHKSQDICEKNDCLWGKTGKCSKKRENSAKSTPVKKSRKSKLELTPIEKHTSRVARGLDGSVHLESQEGTSNKFYNLDITETENGYLLDQNWGPIGKNARRHKDWPRPEDYYPSYESANEALGETVEAKLKKGYHYA